MSIVASLALETLQTCHRHKNSPYMMLYSLTLQQCKNKIGPVCLPRSEQERGPATPEDASYYVLPQVAKATRGRPKKGQRQ
jgi:hypothetical protein